MITDVGVDIDGVMFDFATVIHERTAEYMGTPIPFPSRWEFYEDWGMTDENFHSYLKRLTIENEIFNQGSPYHNTKEGWESLRSQNINIHVITHRPWEACEQTVRWLERFQLIPDSLHFTGKKAGVLKGITNTIIGDECASIDDHYDQYINYQYQGVHSFLRSQPWNEKYVGRRTNDLLDFAETIRFYNKKWTIKE